MLPELSIARTNDRSAQVAVTAFAKQEMQTATTLVTYAFFIARPFLCTAFRGAGCEKAVYMVENFKIVFVVISYREIFYCGNGAALQL